MARAGAPLELQPANMRSSRDFKKAQRHSRIVRSLRFVLPILAVVLIAGFFAAGMIARNVPDQVEVNSAAVSDGQLIMESPNLSGFDKENRPYDVKADRATQSLSNNGVIQLEGIDAKLPADKDSFAKLQAGRGSYDSNTETMNLEQQVKVRNSEGTTLSLENANVDLKSGQITSEKPVKVQTDRATITSESVELFDKGERIVFKKRVRMTIGPEVLRNSGSSNPLEGLNADSVSNAVKGNSEAKQ